MKKRYKKYDGSALVVAAINNRLPVLSFMLNKGLDVNVQDKVAYCYFAVLTILILNKDGNAALIGATREGHKEAIELILQYNPDLNITDKVKLLFRNI